MMMTSDLVVMTALMLALAVPALGAEYYLSPEGDDEAAGTRDAPWLSIEKANATLEAGDTAIFLPGEYAGTIAPVNSGAADQPITFRSEEPRAARIVPSGGGTLIALDGH
jgi:hypothetical protein